MTIKDWMDYDWRCGVGRHCETCLYEYACKAKFHCGAETYTKLIQECKTKEEVKRFVDRIRGKRGITWTLACNGKGMYERGILRENTKTDG